MTSSDIREQLTRTVISAGCYHPSSLLNISAGTDLRQMHVEVFLEENAIADTCPRLIGIRNADVEISE